jgi:alpha-tubulin suppressor-like RCC1 family protein
MSAGSTIAIRPCLEHSAYPSQQTCFCSVPRKPSRSFSRSCRAQAAATAIGVSVALHGFAQGPPFVHTELAATPPMPTFLDGMLVPNNLATTSWFEWGTNSNYGTVAPVADVFSDGQLHRVGAAIGGLATGRTYHFRLVGSNTAAVVYGSDKVFRAEAGGKLAAWGANNNGQCVIPAGLSNIVALAGNDSGSLALRADGTVAFWGVNPVGIAALAASVTNLIAISESFGHVLALDADGIVHACGGGLGPGGEAAGTNVPPGLSNVVAIAAGGSDGDYHSLALRADGKVVAWGSNRYGQTNVPVSLTNVVAISAGDYHNLALQANGRVIGWGSNGYGQTNTSAIPPWVTAIASAGFHNMALMTNGGIIAWGDTYGGGPGASTLTNAIAISTGGDHSEALRSNGLVTSWGFISGYGDAAAPPGLSNVVLLAGGSSHIMALGHNVAPVQSSIITYTYPNTDRVIQLPQPFDPNSDPVQVLIKYPPTSGQLFQCNAGARGPEITAGATAVTDPSRQVIYTPPPNSVSDVYGAFYFIATDGEMDSSVQYANVQLFLPSAPHLDAQRSNRQPNGDFELNFTGQPGVTYRVWAATNLVDWELLGFGSATSNGWFQFLDSGAAGLPRRFYRATSP